jgi:hypothetical protein
VFSAGPIRDIDALKKGDGGRYTVTVELTMTHSEFNHILSSIEALSPDQMRRLLRELQSRMTGTGQPPLSEAEFKRQLLESGLMTSLPTPPDPAARRAFQPVKIEGEPLSETIIRERR